MAAIAEDLTFGDFSDLGVEEYQDLFGNTLQASYVELPWDDKNVGKSPFAGDGGAGTTSCAADYGVHAQAQNAYATGPSDPCCGGPAAVGPQQFQPGSQAPCHNYANSPDGQWNGPGGAVAFSESQERSSDGVAGNDSQIDDGVKKRRNKKRRDPDYYKRYYGSFENNSSSENGSMLIKDDKCCAVASVAVAPHVISDSKTNIIASCPPMYTYNADEKSTERTIEPTAPVAAPDFAITAAHSAMNALERTPNEGGFDTGKSKTVPQDHESVSEAPGAAAISVNQGDVASGPSERSTAADTTCIQTPVVPGDLPVPTIHISPSESNSSDTPADAFDGGFPAMTPEGSAQQAAPAAPAPAAAAAPAQPATKSWASLFKGGSAGQAGGAAGAPYVAISVSSPSPEEERDETAAGTPVPTDQDPHAKTLGEHLSKAAPSHHPMNLQPRGLINTANWCYINSIMQALLSCPPFYHIMKNLPLNNGVRKSSSTPMLDAMFQFLNEFQEVRGVSKRSPQDIRPGLPFEPTNIYQMLSVAQTSLAVKLGRQEDAEEFLSCLLNGLHDEMTSLIQSSHGDNVQATDVKPNGPASVAVANGEVGNGHRGDGSGEEDEWEQVGPRNKTSITRRAEFSSSPLSKIFGGIMRSALHQHGSKESATLQPFFSLQLDVQSPDIWTVQNALDTLGNRESVHGFMSNKTKKEVEAFRRITLEELPPVLVLHLKRFIYDKSGGCQKLMKKVDYSMEIEINKDLISPNAKSRISVTQRSYKLFAVVYHTGKEASGGHYITDVYHVGTSSWLRCDDSIVKPVKPMQVTKPLSSTIPYLLFYRRKDLLTKPTS